MLPSYREVWTLEIEIEGGWRRLKSTGEVKIYGSLRGRRYRLGYVEYVIGTEITLTDLRVDRHCRNQGLGRLLIMIVQALALKLKVPIYAPEAFDEASVFYKKMGFKPILECNVKIMNLNPRKPLEAQVGENDLIWIPKGLKEPIELYM